MIDPVARDYRAIRGDPGDRKCAAALARGRGGGGGRGEEEKTDAHIFWQR